MTKVVIEHSNFGFVVQGGLIRVMHYFSTLKVLPKKIRLHFFQEFWIQTERMLVK